MTRCASERPLLDSARALKALQASPRSPEAKLVAALEAQLDVLDDATAQRLVTAHARLLGVSVPRATVASLKALLSQMAAAARQNPYLRNVLAAAPAIEVKDPARVGDVLAFAHVLEHTSRALATDPDALAAFVDRAPRPTARGPAYGYKFHIVEEAVHCIVNAQREQAVAPDALRDLLKQNINVMSAIDAPANNVAGLRLSARAAGNASFDPKSQLIRMAYQADAHEWVSLYGAWNLVLGMQTAAAPYFATKLLIPFVGDYHADPESYMHKRVVALYVFMAWRNRNPQEANASAPQLADQMAPLNAVNARFFEARAQLEGYGKGDDQGLLTKLVNRIKRTPELWRKTKVSSLLMDELRARH